MTTKENFIRLYNYCKESVIDAMDRALKNSLENEVINFDELEDNFKAVYPLIAAVLHREADFCTDGGSYESDRRKMRRQCNNYRKDMRVWHEMAK